MLCFTHAHKVLVVNCVDGLKESRPCFILRNDLSKLYDEYNIGLGLRHKHGEYYRWHNTHRSRCWYSPDATVKVASTPQTSQ